MSRLSVVVPARDAAATLGATLDALAAQTGAPPHEVVVVDDGSRDETARLAERHPLGPRVVCLGRPGGAGPARDAGVAAATPDSALAFTDADCRPEPGWLAAGARALDGAELVQGRVLPAAGPRPRGPYDHTIAVDAQTPLFETANLFVTRAAYEAAGGFGPGLERSGRPFGEDTAFAWRARRTGARAAFCADAVVVHAVLPGGPRDLLRERRRLRHFPALAAQVPEPFAGRRFLSARTARVDLAVAGALAALLLRSPLPLVAALPHARRLRAEAADARHLAVLAAGDLVGLLSLVQGSLEARRILL